MVTGQDEEQTTGDPTQHRVERPEPDLRVELLLEFLDLRFRQGSVARGRIVRGCSVAAGFGRIGRHALHPLSARWSEIDGAGYTGSVGEATLRWP